MGIHDRRLEVRLHATRLATSRETARRSAYATDPLKFKLALMGQDPAPQYVAQNKAI